MWQALRVVCLMMVGGLGLGAALHGSSQKTLASGEKPATASDGVVIAATDAVRNATWTLVYRWEGVGEGRTQITFKDDGTFFTAQRQHGRWFQINRNVVFSFDGVSGVPDWSIVYSATLNENYTAFSGIQGYSHTSGRPKGTHIGFRAARAIEDVTKLEHSGVSVTGEAAK